MDSERMGYLRDYDRWAKGVFAGTFVRGQLHGCSFPIQPGADGRRSVVVNGVGYVEENASGTGRRGRITIAKRAR
jgi:hypothetical protein